jgi:hypothetical protein
VVAALASLIVTVNLYVPENPTVTVVFFAALVPLTLYVGVGAPLGTVVAAHV